MIDGSDLLPIQSTPSSIPVAIPVTSGPVAAVPRGLKIAGYELLNEVGRGGMGVVYRARQNSLNRVVALKVVIGGAFAGDAERGRFRMEAEALGRLHHPNIIQVFDVGEEGGVAYIAFEFVDGPTLRKWQDGRPLAPRVAAGIAADIAWAIQHAHEMGIVHRDLKPGNILLASPDRAGESPHGSRGSVSTSLAVLEREGPRAKVGDFGLAKALDSNAMLTASGATCGTPNYMSPEQVRGDLHASRPPVDIWGVGAVLFEMLTGRPPFTGADAPTIMQEIALGLAPSARQFAPQTPRDLAVIVGKCLEKDPKDRYLTAGEAAADLERFLAGAPILARPAGPAVRLGRWVKRNPIPSLVGLFLAISLVSVSAFAAMLQQSEARERRAREGESAALVEEARLRKKADDALGDAERARDAIGKALGKTKAALDEAQAERKRAEANLTVARRAVRHVLATATSLGENDDPALIPAYRNLLMGLEPFIAEIIAQKTDDRDVRFDQFEIARQLAILEDLQGRTALGREHALLALNRIRELAGDHPGNRRYELELAKTLGLLGALSGDLKHPDKAAYLQEARERLDHILAEEPKHVEALHELVRVELSRIARPGSNEYTEEHDRLVLETVERLESIGGPTPYLTKTRAHALNNIASDLTNRGKTDDAEWMWLEVLQLREGLFKAHASDRIARYELGKCLSNYANQLARTGRDEQAFLARERAVQLFDALRDDARNRTTYAQLMLDLDFLVGRAYLQSGKLDLAADRWTKAIALSGALAGRDPAATRMRAIHADAYTRRAETFEQLNRHAEAARDYKNAGEFSTNPSHRDYCLARQVRALASAGDRRGATALALKRHPDAFAHPQPCVELALAWLAIGKSAGAEEALAPEVRQRAAADALGNAKTCILAAQKKGFYQSEEAIRQFHARKEFEPIWDVFPR